MPPAGAGNPLSEPYGIYVQCTQVKRWLWSLFFSLPLIIGRAFALALA
jgi:hypothetical protein